MYGPCKIALQVGQIRQTHNTNTTVSELLLSKEIAQVRQYVLFSYFLAYLSWVRPNAMDGIFLHDNITEVAEAFPSANDTESDR